MVKLFFSIKTKQNKFIIIKVINQLKPNYYTETGKIEKKSRIQIMIFIVIKLLLLYNKKVLNIYNLMTIRIIRNKNISGGKIYNEIR